MQAETVQGCLIQQCDGSILNLNSSLGLGVRVKGLRVSGLERQVTIEILSTSPKREAQAGWDPSKEIGSPLWVPNAVCHRHDKESKH